jgi:hypothetical protein
MTVSISPDVASVSKVTVYWTTSGTVGVVHVNHTVDSVEPPLLALVTPGSFNSSVASIVVPTSDPLIGATVLPSNSTAALTNASLSG